MENFIFCAGVGLQTAGCNATKTEILTKFLQGLLKVSENVEEELCNLFPSMDTFGWMNRKS